MDKREIIAEFASLLFSAMENAKAESVDLATLNGFRENLDFLLSIGEEAQINERAYQNYEYDENEPRIRTAIRIADALGVKDVRSLWGGNPVRA